MTKELSMFKLYDIRAKHGDLTAEMTERLIAAVAKYYAESVQADSVFIGRDARLYCAELMDRILEIFPCYGLDVIFNPVPVSTCQFYYSCMQNRSCGGIMLTASHNPKEYAGMKLVGKDVNPIAMGCGPDGGLEQVLRNYQENVPAPAGEKRGRVRVAQYQREYVEYSLRLAGIAPGELRGLKVFGEFLSGSAGVDFALAMEIAGADYTLSHAVPDGRFPHGDPNPLIESSVAPARQAVREGEYDLGFCFDGDGDRLDLMYPDGSQVIPGLNMSLLVPYVKELFRERFGMELPFKAYADVKAVPLALKEIAAAGMEQHIIRNGHSFIKEKLKEHFPEGFIVCEEESAHYYMCFPFDMEDLSQGFAATENTLFFALLSAKAMKEHPEEYRRIYTLQKEIYRCREWPILFRDPEEMRRALEEIERMMRGRGAEVIRLMDDGSDLDATLMRVGLPRQITADTVFPASWCQVAQRISRTEDGMARIEVVASDEALCQEMNGLVRSATDAYVRRGAAAYKNEN